MELAKKGLIKNHVQKFNLSEVNDAEAANILLSVDIATINRDVF